MKTIPTFTAFLFSLFSFFPSGIASEWLTSLEEAQELARANNQFILVDFWASWCGPCQAMDFQVWSSKNIQILKTKFIPLKVNIDKHPDLAYRFKVTAIPTVLLITAGGEIIYRKQGYIDRAYLAEILQSFPFDASLVQSAMDQYMVSPENPYARFSLAKTLQKIGSKLPEVARRAFIEKSDESLSAIVYDDDPEKDARIIERAKLTMAMNLLIIGQVKKGIRRIEEEIGLANLDDSHQAYAYFILINGYLQRKEQEKAHAYYLQLKETVNNAKYLKALEEVFEVSESFSGKDD